MRVAGAPHEGALGSCVTRVSRPEVVRALALGAGADDPLPTEFLIFKAGVNPTRNGYSVLFDERAAAQVMADYEAHGVDLMIDLGHLSLPEELGGRPDRLDAHDARGWCQLELRDGELWAVGVRWTPDGADRLRTKKQRYTSPAFTLDADNRPVSVVNIALLSMPGTDHLPALVAAGRQIGGKRSALARAAGYVALVRARAKV